MLPSRTLSSRELLTWHLPNRLENGRTVATRISTSFLHAFMAFRGDVSI